MFNFFLLHLQNTDSESKQNVYLLESCAVMIMALLWILSFPFSFNFYIPLFKKRNDVPLTEKINYSAKQYSLITFLVTIEGWTEKNTTDEESDAIQMTDL